MISDAQEARQAAGARPKQDAKFPLLINIDDGRLYPNVPKMRLNPKYVPYGGDVKASKADRLRWLDTMGRSLPSRRRVVMDDSTAPPFDIGKATASEIVEFALTEYGKSLDPGMNLHTLRATVRKLAQEAGSLAD
jgi:hypothetical protein